MRTDVPMNPDRKAETRSVWPTLHAIIPKTTQTLCYYHTYRVQNLLLDYHPTRHLRSSSAHLFSIPAVTSTFASRAFSVSVLTVWNSLKPDLRSVDSLDSFKSQLKKLKTHCSLQLTAALNSTVQRYPALLIRSLFATWALYRLCIVLYCNVGVNRHFEISHLSFTTRMFVIVYIAISIIFIFIHQKAGSSKEQTSSIKTNARIIKHTNTEHGAENTHSATNYLRS